MIAWEDVYWLLFQLHSVIVSTSVE
jgi:hypothetical protein